jgi:hypothetical protein
VTFQDHVLPIFRNACNNCHNPDKKKAGLDLTTYQAAMAGSENGPVVKAGNADGSLLYKVTTHAEEPVMPPKGDKVGESDLALIKAWINGFALETANSKAVAVQNKVESVVVSLKRPDGPAPMPGELPMEPLVRTKATTSVTAMAANPWAPVVALGGQKQVFLYHTETGEPLGIVPFDEGYPEVLRFSRNGKLLMVGGGLGGKLGKVMLWDLAKSERIGTVGDETDTVLAADISPDQQYIALGGPSKRVKIFQTKDGKLVYSMKKHTDWVTAVAFSADGKYLATGDRNGGLVIWDGPTDKEHQTLAGHKGMITSLAFMPGLLASGSEDGKITFWDAKEGDSAKSWTAHANGVLCIDFTPDGRLVSSGRDKVAKVWDQTGKLLVSTETQNDIATRCALAGERIAVGSWNGEVRIYDGTGKRVGELSANPPSIAEQLARFEADRTRLAAEIAVHKAAVESASKKLAQERAEAAQRKAAAIAGAREALAKIESERENEKSRGTAAQNAASVARDAVAAGETELDAAKKRKELATAEAEAAPEPEKSAKREALERSKTEVVKATQELQARIETAKRLRTEAEKVKSGVEKTIARLATAANDASQRLQRLEATPERPAAMDGKEISAPVVWQSEAELNAAKGLLAQAEAAMSKTVASQRKWELAASFQRAFDSQRSLNRARSRREELVATAKDAFQQVEQARAALASARDRQAKAPSRIAAAQARVAEVEKVLETERKRAVAMEQKIAQIGDTPVGDPVREVEGEKKVAAAQAALTALETEIAMRRDERAKTATGTPEYEKANERVQAVKPKIAQASEVLAAAKKELQEIKATPSPEVAALKKQLATAREALPSLAQAVEAATQQLQTERAALSEAGKTVSDLVARMSKLEAAAKRLKQDSETEAQRLTGEIEKMRKESEQRREEFEKMKERISARQEAIPDRRS